MERTIKSDMGLHRLMFLFLGLILSTTAFPQKYMDIPYLQDHAEKYEIKTDRSMTELLEVSCDRNKNIKILSSDGLLQPWDNKLSADQQYQPINDMKILSLKVYKDQFFYLTDQAILSNAWAGKFYIKHNIDQCTNFA